MKQVDIVGIAGILPLDHTFLLGSNRGKVAALRELRSIEAIVTQPRVAFPFESYRRSGGGRIANILACLGASGEQVAVCGAVGDDEAGRIVLDELANNRVDTHHVRVCARRHTRVVLLLGTRGAPSAQVHVKQKPLARFSSGLLGGLPPCEILLIGRANRAVLQHIINHRAMRAQKVSAHIGSWPWRNGEVELHKELLRNVDILVVDSTVLRLIKRSFQFSDLSPLEELAKHTSAKLVVAYTGVNQVEAILTGTTNIIRPDDREGTEVTDPTGMMESFHGGLLSFILRHRSTLEHAQFTRAALGYANEIAAIAGRGVGARHFASLREQELLQQTYLRASGLFRYDIAISFAGENRPVADEIAEGLAKVGLSVFYDKYAEADLWGKDLFTHLQDVYRRQSRFCLMLVSEAYRQKQWTNHERRAAQARAFEDSREYILPVRLDDVELPGLLPTDGYLDLRKIPVGRLIELIRDKVRMH